MNNFIDCPAYKTGAQNCEFVFKMSEALPWLTKPSDAWNVIKFSKNIYVWCRDKTFANRKHKFNDIN